MLVTYGARALALPPASNAYEGKYKGTWVCLLMLARAMSGNYVNFGVFDLYGDPALKVRPHFGPHQNTYIVCNRFGRISQRPCPVIGRS